MLFERNPRLRLVSFLGGGVALVFLLLGALQWWNTSRISFLNPETAGETLAFTAFTVVLFLLLIALLMLLLRNLLKLYAGQGSSALGARLRNRMVLGAVLIALTPAVLMYLYSFQFMNRTIERWFSPNTTQLRDDSTRVVEELAHYVTSNARVEAESIAASGAPDRPLNELESVLGSHRITLAGGFALVYEPQTGQAMHLISSFGAPAENIQASLLPWLDETNGGRAIPLGKPLSSSLLAAARRSDESIVEIAGQQFALGTAATASGKLVLVALPTPQGLSETAIRIRSGATEYWKLYRLRHNIRGNFFLLLLLITVFIFFSSVWLAVFLSRQITRPVEALADAMSRIAEGRYEQRVSIAAAGEMGDLVRSFNRMASDLETSRRVAETSSAQLTAANQAIEERRHELETIVETIPSGVVTLDGAGRVLQANRAFAALISHREGAPLRGQKMDSLLPAEYAEEVAAVIRRGRRMGAASTEIEMRMHGRAIHLALTSARLDFGSSLSTGTRADSDHTAEEPGTVLVMEDTTELLRAQRQLAWKEVAQRVAHEIKNPLTPIQLSAERIARHLDRGRTEGTNGVQPDSANIIRKCSEVILTCVGTLRTLVDQFSALAQFPAPQPRVCEMNRIVDEALALFAGRLDSIELRLDLAPDLPPVFADPEAIRRALANLIDNAAEAMQGSLLKVLSVSTTVSEDGAAVEASVGDTGPGLTDEIRERLFLPFYSTKQRGTGLGLSIAAKIAQEHGGSIRAESNTPKGARFLLRIPLIENPALLAAYSAPAMADSEPVKEARS
ncbi:sensor histidine kinase [Terracidiphilus gabretensis]|uniref:sensor histidine kinase n=1 Tax=Terracidiphilus gabretensis TaxID=1577687 RepID=UPI00071C02EF|nr:ATP-binding protein [Terracidiphilus gabretensis]